MNQNKNITTMVLTTLAVFIFVLFMHTFVSPMNNDGSIIPSTTGALTGIVIVYALFGSIFENPFRKLASILFGFPIAGLFVGILRYLKIDVTLSILSLLLATGIFISVVLFMRIDEKTGQRGRGLAYATDERGKILNYRSATVGFIALSVFLLAYLIKGYLEPGVFDTVLLLTLSGGWIALIVARQYYEWRM
ncbi:MAG: hypothetical protein C4B59_13745 [Candidatus Methanogaster sp.]|uniref:Uncharacterized protein n=1 Tax=Candidatus Methanogaster sp. TaxID=3386292 RepID=A0AC61L013_9EURY|nr:MAG: hypothetical protein C4B59_13745 [ANME-2 cluster archaeon]